LEEWEKMWPFQMNFIAFFSFLLTMFYQNFVSIISSFNFAKILSYLKMRTFYYLLFKFSCKCSVKLLFSLTW
jgi:hypothetical protein